MKIKFDSNQQFQIDAVNAVVDIFEGLPLKSGNFEVNLASEYEGLLENVERSELGFGNNLTLSEEELLKNIHNIQNRNKIKQTSTLQGKEFSVEMETGTGKTYVYLRTIFELNAKFGFNKFVIVVPSVAIREGTLKNLEITKDHFKKLYNNVPFDFAVYDSKKMNIVKNFATSSELQILVINIDAFRKDFKDENDEDKGVLFHRPSEKLNDRSPREYIQATHPIVIIDEPQSVDTTPKAKYAIKTLNPLCTLRYSATHRNPYNLVYRLDPIMAYNMKLVKRIAVASVENNEGGADAFVKLTAVDNQNGLRAKIEYHEQTDKGVSKKSKWIKSGVDLYDLSRQRDSYRNGYIVSEISAEPDNEHITFSPSGIRLGLNEECGGYGDDIKKLQIEKIVKEHLDKENQVNGRGIKVLTLFFIDRVANYRSYDEAGNVVPGKYAIWFEEVLGELLKKKEYQGLLSFNIPDMHDGYFAQDKDGKLKDTKGNTQADESTYDKIMKNKEQLLSLNEPLRFIFSHSALREGWDNPNVFQICTLNETNTDIKKRQEIGRGMRLPVDQNGERVFDDSINKLVVMANENYKDFADKLQKEYAEDCGVVFGLIPKNAFAELNWMKNGVIKKVGEDESEKIWNELLKKNYIDEDGKLTDRFPGELCDFKINNRYERISINVYEIVDSYHIERYIRPHKNPVKIKLNKRIYLDENFKELWEKINKKTTYSVNYSTEELIKNTVKKIDEMPRIRPVVVKYTKAMLDIEDRGVDPRLVRNEETEIKGGSLLPDVLAYMQRSTNLTRKTIYTTLTKCQRLEEFKINPQKFMDQVVDIIRKELNQLMIEGIKYEKIAGEEYEMQLFEQDEMLSHLDNLLESKKSIYDFVEYDSKIEKEFAKELERRDYIKMFVKLPSWFKVETPIGTYNPDWAIVKHGDNTLYLVRETKGNKDFMQLRNSEVYKVQCGAKHFAELGVDYSVINDANDL
ncbi:MAG: DEAD/DEAH box helicase family protein [Candidatus Falkowbacteria bacterium]